MKIITHAFGKHIENHKFKYLLMLFAIFCGLVLGFVAPGWISGGDEASNFILDFCTRRESISNSLAFWQSLSVNSRLFLLILLAGLLPTLRLLSPVSLGIKGFTMGYALGLTTLMFGAKGFLLSFISVLSQSLTVIPVLIYMAVCASTAEKSARARWLVRCGLFAFLLVICSLFDGFIVPVFISGAAKLF